MFHPEVKHFADHIEDRSNKTIAGTVVAKELAKCVYHVLTKQEKFKTFKGIKLNKLRDWPRWALARVPNWRGYSFSHWLIGI